MEDKIPSAFYKLTDARSQIRSYVYDVIRSSIPRLDIDAAFASKDEVANAVKAQLESLMSEYGYQIIAALVIDLDPNPHVKAAMNDINGASPLSLSLSISLSLSLSLSLILCACLSVCLSY
jgi:regulator of protease activity HflC (stomatin/prohibitin superfamily)